MIGTFSAAVKFLESYIPTPDKKHPGELGIKRMQYLMDFLGNPQLKYPTIHVGGTSGKGSTSTIIASILATKYKVGLHTSPHLVKINERIKVSSFNIKHLTFNKEIFIDISDKEFIKLVNFIKPFVEKVKKSELGGPSYFEIVTAMAFLHFYQEKVDFAVIEVGMGGRFDATNVIKPMVAVLTNVGLDHTEILGDTVEKIARDKTGIIKKEAKVVSGVKQPSVIDILEATGNRQQAKVSLSGRDFGYKIKKINEAGSIFDYYGKLRLKNLKLNLLGEYQVENATLAIKVIEELTTGPAARVSQVRASIASRNDSFTNHNRFSRSQGEALLGNPSLASPVVSIKEERRGLLSAFIPGRLEIIKQHPLVILDGAHNPDKVKALIVSIKKIFPKKKVTTILAIKSDKNTKDMLIQLLAISQRVIFTKFKLTADLGVITSYDPHELLNIAKTIDRDKPLSIINDAKTAIAEAVKSAEKNDLILITGSLYLVGEASKYYKSL